MPDISMCEGGSCPQKLACYRHRAVPTPQRQAYFATPPARPDGSCAYFDAIRKGDVLTEKEP